MKTNQDFKNAALAALKGNWTPAVLLAVVYLAIIFIYMICSMLPVYIPSLMKYILVASGVSMLINIFVRLPFEVGFSFGYLRLYQAGEPYLVRVAVDRTLTKYWKNLWCMILLYLKVILWSLLLIVPGIIKVFEYAMAPFILAENPEIGALEAIHRSSAMMKGHRFDLFYLILSFIGWYFLCILTLGIGFLWLIPYAETSVAAFYENLKEPEIPVIE